MALSTLALVAVAVGRAAVVSNLPPNAKFDYQIGGPYTPAPDVKVVTRDRTASPVPGLFNICYINAYQTQDTEKAFWNGA